MKQIIVATIGLLASAITASLSFYFTKKLQLKTEDRRLKEEYYKSFLKALSDVAINNDDDEAQKRLSEGFNFLLVTGSPKVVKNLMEFHNFVRKDTSDTIPRNSKEWVIEHDKILKELVKAIREDIFGKEKNVDIYLENLHLVGKKS